MKGFLYKDLALFRNLGKSYLFILAVFFVLTLLHIYPPVFMFMMLSLLIGMFPSTSFSYDELAKWDRFAASVPGGRKKVVQGKYIFALLVALGILATGLLLTLPLAFLSDEPPSRLLFSCVLSASGTLFLNAVMLPLLFHFGPQKGRLFVIVACAFTAAMVGVSLSIADMAFFGAEPSLLLILFATLLLILAILAISYRISLHIYQKKEF